MHHDLRVDLFPGREVDGAVEDDVLLLGDEFELLLGAFAEGADVGGQQAHESGVVVLPHRADGGDGDVGEGYGLALHAVHQADRPLDAGGHHFGDRAAGVGGEGRPLLEHGVGGVFAAEFSEGADEFELEAV